MEIKKCKKCGEAGEVAVISNKSPSPLYFEFYVKCSKCTYTTKLYKTTDEATDEWNDYVRLPARATEKSTTMDIKTIKIEDLIDGKEKSTFPIDIFPNNMGINLCAVDSITFARQADGQLVYLVVNFIPDNE